MQLPFEANFGGGGEAFLGQSGGRHWSMGTIFRSEMGLVLVFGCWRSPSLAVFFLLHKCNITTMRARPIRTNTPPTMPPAMDFLLLCDFFLIESAAVVSVKLDWRPERPKWQIKVWKDKVLENPNLGPDRWHCFLCPCIYSFALTLFSHRKPLSRKSINKLETHSSTVFSTSSAVHDFKPTMCRH